MAINLYPRAMNQNATYFPNQSSQWNTTHNMLTTATAIDKNPMSQNLSTRNIPTQNPRLEPVELPSPNTVSSGISGMGNKVGEFLSSPTGAIGMGAVSGLIGGFLGNQQIKSANSGLLKGISSFESRLSDLKRQREEATQYRKGEATDFLTNYVTARDPNRSAQISQMYATGQDRYRNELQNNDAMQSQVNAGIAQLQAQKQKEMNGFEIAGQGLLGAAQMIPFALMG